MNVPDIFKYNMLISVPLFGLVYLCIIRNTVGYSFTKETISKSINFYNHPLKEFIFRINFAIKSLLDLGFIWYLVHQFSFSKILVPTLLLTLSALLFASLAYFIEGKRSTIHGAVIYSAGIFWAAGHISLAYLIGSPTLIQLALFFVTTPVIIAFGFLFAKKTNVIVQIVCMSIWQIYLFILLQYL
jgi:hypothetical protein